MTTQFHPPDPAVLKDSVVVLTGGALGVGASLVRILASAGAHVFFGDVLDDPGKALEKDLSSGPSTIKFIHCDVTSYQDNLALFDAALKAFGRIDHAIANAGLAEQGNMYDPDLTLEAVREEPKRGMLTVEVNLKGPMYFARIAAVYLRQGGGAKSKSLTLVSSVAGFREDPGLYAYTAAKHGVMGLMRSLRVLLYQSKPASIRTNAICPWMTKTRLVVGLEDEWAKAGLPANTPEDVANVIAGVAADGQISGAALFIEGGRAWNVEQGLVDARPLWIGEERAAALDRGTALMGGGAVWTAHQKP